MAFEHFSRFANLYFQAAEYFRQMNNHSAEFVFLKYAQSNQVSFWLF